MRSPRYIYFSIQVIHISYSYIVSFDKEFTLRAEIYWVWLFNSNVNTIVNELACLNVLMNIKTKLKMDFHSTRKLILGQMIM